MAYCEEVIITEEGRGNGTIQSPSRRVIVIYRKNGDKLAEYDPNPDTYVFFDLIHFSRWFSEKQTGKEATPDDVKEWLRHIREDND